MAQYHRRRSRGGQRGQLLPPTHLQTGRGQTVSNAPSRFRRLSGMMPEGTEKQALGTCESEISVRIESRIESGVVVYMFNADCHVGVVYVL